MSRIDRRQIVRPQDQHLDEIPRTQLLECAVPQTGHIVPEDTFEKRRNAEGNSQLPIDSHGYP
jgi:hypothetical protein